MTYLRLLPVLYVLDLIVNALADIRDYRLEESFHCFAVPVSRVYRLRLSFMRLSLPADLENRLLAAAASEYDVVRRCLRGFEILLQSLEIALGFF